MKFAAKVFTIQHINIAKQKDLERYVAGMTRAANITGTGR